MDYLYGAPIYELEQRLEVAFYALIDRLFDHSPDVIRCRFTSKRCLTIMISGIRTLPEQQLLSQGNQTLADEFRDSLHTILSIHTRHMVEQIVQSEVVSLDMPQQSETDQLGLIISVKPSAVLPQ